MMSRWLALIRTSSSNGKSHSKRTSKVCTSRKTLVTLSNPIIQPMSWSCTASCKGRVLVRLSILSTDMATLPWFQTLQFQIPIKWFLKIKFTFNHCQASCRSPHCPNTSLVSPGPTPNLSLLLKSFIYFSLLISRQVVGVLILSKHLTCVSRTHSQPQPVEIFSSISQKHVVSGNQLTSHFHQMT